MNKSIVKQLVPFFLSMVIPGIVIGQTPDTVKKYIAEITSLIKTHSLFKDSLNWPLIQADISILSADMHSLEDTKPVKDYLIDQLRSAGDNHSFFISSNATKNYERPPSSTAKQTLLYPTGKILNGTIGYIYIPSFGSVNQSACDSFATVIQMMIREFDSRHTIQGWIVDLRDNMGGNMYPMIAGIGPLAGEGTLGYFVRGDYRRPWRYTKGHSGGVGVKNFYKLKNNHSKIAVLIGPRTASSGEMTAISLLGNINSKSFGQESGGYTTANVPYPLSDGSSIVLAVSFVEDRNKKPYTGKIVPDMPIVYEKDNDTAVKWALKWLQE